MQLKTNDFTTNWNFLLKPFHIPSMVSLSIVFIVFLFYFLFGTGWYPASKLKIDGIAPKVGTKIKVRWESGEGFNDYEKEQYDLSTTWPNGKPIHTISIRRVNEGDDKSELSFLVRSDGRHRFNSTDLNDQKKTVFDVLAKNNIRLDFQTKRHTEKIIIEINERVYRYDLFVKNWEVQRLTFDFWIIAPDGSFSVIMPIPRYPIRTMVIENVDGKTPMHFHKIESVSAYENKSFIKNEVGQSIKLNNFDGGRKRYWHFTRFVFQCLFAAISTWILFGIVRSLKKLGGLKSALLSNNRLFFWMMFAFALMIFSIWLIAFWPGVMSVDSMKIWRAAHIPGYFINDHPILNVIFYMYLMSIWDHTAIVPIAQIVLVSLMGSYIFFSIYRKGVHIKYLIPFYLFFVFSVPIGLYNVTLWKDIPFALLITFWAYKLADFYYHKKRGTLIISKENWIVLFLLFLSVVFIRHNGFIYIVVIPFMMLALRLIQWKHMVVVLVMTGITIFSTLIFLRNNLDMGHYNFFFEMTKKTVHQIRQIPLAPKVSKMATNYFHLFDINRKNHNSDFWHYYLRDRDAYTFLKKVGWNDTYSFVKPKQYPFEKLTKICLKIYSASLENPWIFFQWNPSYILGLFLFAIVLSKIFSLAGIFSSFIIFQIITLLLIDTLNWRYYYFAFFPSFFLIPMMIIDLKNRFSMLSKS